jgi:hypothetical protein
VASEPRDDGGGDKEMTDLFKNFPEIIKVAAQNPLGIAALIILVVTVIAITFFRKAKEKARLAIFTSIIVGFLGFGLAIFIIVTLKGNKSSSTTTLSTPASPVSTKTSTPSSENRIKICPHLDIKFIRRFPYYLINTFKKNRRNPYIYWAVLEGENDCNEPKPVEIRFAVRNKTVAQATDVPWKKTFKIGEKVTEFTPIDPQFEFLRRIENTTLDVTWEIRDEETNKVIASGTKYIGVLSENYVDWDLKDNEGRVPVDFLIASLTAWTLAPEEVIRTRAQKYLQESGAPANAAETCRQWLRLCYEDLFHSPKGIKIQPLTKPWPPLGEKEDSLQSIKTPAEILQTKKANSLEAALLMAALWNGASGRIESRFCLFVIPKTGGFFTGGKQFILAWSANDSEWHGIDLTDPNKISFDDNEKSISANLNKFLNTRRDALAALDEKGVFVDDKSQILVIDFDKAHEKFSIGALPHSR